MKSLSVLLLGAGLFTLALCGCTSQSSQKEVGVSDSIVKDQGNPVIETIMARVVFGSINRKLWSGIKCKPFWTVAFMLPME